MYDDNNKVFLEETTIDLLDLITIEANHECFRHFCLAEMIHHLFG